MAIHFGGSPGSISAEETVLKDTDTPITMVIDKFNYVFLTPEQARSLWHELGAVLQSLDHDDDKAAAIANLEDLRGLPHSSDLESRPPNSRR